MKTALLIGFVLLMQQVVDAQKFYHSHESRESSEEYWHTRPSALPTAPSTAAPEPTTPSTTTPEPTTPSTTTPEPTTPEPTTTSPVPEKPRPTSSYAPKSAILDAILNEPQVPVEIVGADGQAIPVAQKDLDDIDFGDINCPNRCTAVYAPVCARSYKEIVLFYNKCVLDVAICRNPYITWEVLPLSRCRYSNEFWSRESWEIYG